jgi:ABC-type dipeptide/oligopeptide/nickel transport system permease component
VNPQFIAIKVLRALITLWLIVTFAFVILRMSGDPIEALVGDEADPEVIAYYYKHLRRLAPGSPRPHPEIVQGEVV